ncbi:Xyloglucan 6-xylosyltransferase [Bertholletia excelsa]
MAKPKIPSKAWSSLRDRALFAGAAVVSFLVVYALCSVVYWADIPFLAKLKDSVASERDLNSTSSCSRASPVVNLRHDPPAATFYDDPSLSYSFGSPVKRWDEKRREWLKRHPSFAADGRERVIVVTGTQPKPCENPIGDHLLLRLFKNKVDYCRIHRYDVFYNNAFLHPKMPAVWAKLPPVKAAMVAHPEAEWIWWLDSDTVFTDMEFKLPLEKYAKHNFVINGWEDMIYEKKSWYGMNTGIFLIRNCQWSMDLMEAWASMSPINPNHEKLAEIVRSRLTDKLFPGLDEQASLLYLMLTEKSKWGEKVYIENQYSLSGYWLEIVDRLENISVAYEAAEGAALELRRRRAEAVSEGYASKWEKYLKGTHDGKGGWRRPFITHFTGCQPCSGHHNPSYTAEKCWKEMEKALNFADNQVLRNYGFKHVSLINSSYASPLPFDIPA